MLTRNIRPVTIALSLAVMALWWWAAPVRSQEDGAAAAAKGTTVEQDLQALQGRWERPLSGADGDEDAHGAARAVKEIKGNGETVTYYDDAGKAVHATAADFELEASGRVKLYTFSNLKVTQGKEKGAGGSDRPLSYIYRVEGDLYHEAHGLLINSPAGSNPSVVRWERAK